MFFNQCDMGKSVRSESVVCLVTCRKEDRLQWMWILPQLERCDGASVGVININSVETGRPRSLSQTSSSSSSPQQHLQHIQTLNTSTSTLYVIFSMLHYFQGFFLIGGTSDCRLCGKTEETYVDQPPSRCPTPGSNMPLLLLLLLLLRVQPQPPSPGFTTQQRLPKAGSTLKALIYLFFYQIKNEISFLSNADVCCTFDSDPHILRIFDL